MNPSTPPPVIATPRRAETIAHQLSRWLAHEGFEPRETDPLLTALIRVGARHAEILTACVNAAPALHLAAFNDFLIGALRPATTAHVHLVFTPAAGNSPVVVPKYSGVTASPLPGDIGPVVFETDDDLRLTRAQCVQASWVDGAVRRWADMAAVATPTGRAPGDPLLFAKPFTDNLHLACPAVFDVAGAVELHVQAVIDPGSSACPIEWGVATPAGWQPLTVVRDGTDGLSHSGEVVLLPAPLEAWAASPRTGIASRWLTLRRRPGDSGATPRLRAASFSVLTSNPARPVDAAFAGAMPLDISKDFFPLGERPRFGDMLVLQSGLFAEPGAQVELRIAMTNPVGSDGPIRAVSRSGEPVLAWEMSTVDGWLPLNVDDGTLGLTQEGVVRFTVPPRAALHCLAGQPGVRLRARLVSGHYGSTASAIPNLPPNPLAPSIRACSVTSTLRRGPLPPSRIARESTLTVEAWNAVPAAGLDAFAPAEPTALYLGFTRGDAPFDASMDDRSRQLRLYVQSSPTIDRAAVPAPATASNAPRWQARTVDGWRDLGVVDGTRGLTVAGLVTLTLPADVAPWTDSRLDPACKLAWLRLIAPVAPPIALLLNAVRATNTQQVRDEILGSSNGRGQQAYRALRTPVIGDPVMQVREPGGEWTVWQPVDDLASSSAASRHFTLDRGTGELRFGDGRHGRIPPPGVNNMRLHRYAVGGGSRGNRPVGTIAQMRSALPAVVSVVNPEASTGGIDAETRAEAHGSAPAWLRHRDRAVSIDDYADLARQASPEVAAAHAVASRNLSLPASIEAEAGVISVIVVPRSTAAQPMPARDLLEAVSAYLDARRAPGGRLVLVGPTYAVVDVEAQVAVAADASAHEVAAECLRRTEAFLHPLTGGAEGRGWAPNRRPHRSDLVALLATVDGVDVVRFVRVGQVTRAAADFSIVAAGRIDVRTEP